VEKIKILSSTNASVYFNNCLVSAIVKIDHPAQSNALSALMRQHEVGRISAVASTEVLGEIQGLPEKYQGPHLEVWNQLHRLPGSRFSWIDETSTSTSAVLDPDYARLCAIQSRQPFPLGAANRRTSRLGSVSRSQRQRKNRTCDPRSEIGNPAPRQWRFHDGSEVSTRLTTIHGMSSLKTFSPITVSRPVRRIGSTPG
jgi:hypothetical protein